MMTCFLIKKWAFCRVTSKTIRSVKRLRSYPKSRKAFLIPFKHFVDALFIVGATEMQAIPFVFSQRVSCNGCVLHTVYCTL